MIALVGVEVSRFAARRVVRWMLILGLLGIVIAAVIVFWNSQEIAPTATAGLRTDESYHYDALRDVVLGLSPLITILSLALGASFVGAEWQRGTMTTVLTWEPRRLRLLVAKLIACLLGGFAITLLATIALAIMLWPAAQFRGTFEGVDSAWATSLFGTVARVGIVAAATCAIGCAITMIGRHTAGALGVAFVYFAVVEGFIRGLKPSWQPWLLGDNAGRFIVANSSSGLPGRSTVAALGVISLYGALLVAAAATFFVRRDVT